MDGKKYMASGIWGRFIIKNFFPLSYMGKHGLGFTVNEPFSFSSFFNHQHLSSQSSHAQSGFYHDFIGLLSIHPLAPPDVIRGCEQKQDRVFSEIGTVFFCSRFAFDTKSLHILLKSGFGMSVQYKKHSSI